MWSGLALVCAAGMIHGGCSRAQELADPVQVTQVAQADSETEEGDAPGVAVRGSTEETESIGVLRRQGSGEELGFVEISAGHRSFSCGLRDNGTVWCWGSGSYGNLAMAARRPGGGLSRWRG